VGISQIQKHTKTNTFSPKQVEVGRRLQMKPQVPARACMKPNRKVNRTEKEKEKKKERKKYTKKSTCTGSFADNLPSRDCSLANR
jgi:hypothetical protein